MISSLYRTAFSMHILLIMLRHPSSLLLSSKLSSTYHIQNVVPVVSAFLTVVVPPPQHQRRRQHHNRIPTIPTKAFIPIRQRSMSCCSSSLTPTDTNSNDHTTAEQTHRPIFDEKHVQKVLFVECGMCFHFIHVQGMPNRTRIKFF
jgi:hypothetical protein